MVASKRTLLIAAIGAAMSLAAFSALAGPGQRNAKGPLHKQETAAAKTLRAQGQAGLDIALARYDALLPGPERDQAALLVDAVAAQRYATHSRLYWFTDLEAAKGEAKRSHRPILSLRLLGRLDEDFSCANSRMFRTLLYPDPKVKSYLRKHFVLHWSSERVAPTMTIDFGNGRVMKSTVGGNSAHYVLSQDGQPLDALPGLFSPSAFLSALAPAHALAMAHEQARDQEGMLRRYHSDALGSSTRRFSALSGKQRRALAPYRSRASGTTLIDAEVLTVSKAMIEAPAARAIAPSASALPDPSAVLASVVEVEKLSANTKALIGVLRPTDWSAEPAALDERAIDTLLSTLARRVAADTLINEHGLRPRIHELLASGPTMDFHTLNERIYADIFVTPASDPWLGMAQPEGFSGLPGDGLITAPLL